jgi:hypothetical protein
MQNVTRSVVSDLWPLYVSGEASDDTRALVEAFFREDPAFAQTLRQTGPEDVPSLETPSLAPDHELKTLQRLRKRIRGPLWLLQLAIMFSCFAFGRIISDTSFDVSPRNFIAIAAVAVCFWVAFFVRLFRGRREVLIRVRR